MPQNSAFEKFNTAMDEILRADPKAVKDAVDAEIQTNTEEREAKGQRKRGRKPKARQRVSSAHASGDKD